MDTVKVEYVGPGSDTDKRILTVSEEEAKRLTRKGLWKVKTQKKRSTNNG